MEKEDARKRKSRVVFQLRTTYSSNNMTYPVHNSSIMITKSYEVIIICDRRLVPARKIIVSEKSYSIPFYFIKLEYHVKSQRFFRL